MYVKSTDGMRPVANRYFAIQMFVDRHRAACQRVAEPTFVQLPTPFPNRHRVVLSHHSLALHREDPVQIRPAATPEGGPFLAGGHSKLGVELGDITLPQKPIGILHAVDSRQAQLLGKPPLPGPKIPLGTTAGLWRIGRNHLHA